MDNLSIKTKAYVVNDKMKVLMPNSKFAYTMECWDENRMWCDGIVRICNSINLNFEIYIEAMNLKFSCIEFENKLFFKTKKQCEEAIEFLDSLLILNNLTRKG